MPRIATILSTNVPQWDPVLRGVYGTVTPGPREGELQFAPAPEFRAISQIFANLPALVDIRENNVHYREVSDEDEALAKAQLLFGLGAKWNDFYSNHPLARSAQAAGGLAASVLAGEMKTIAKNVRDVLSGHGLQVFEVPVIVKGTVEKHGSQVRSLDDMLQGMSARLIDVDATQQPRALGTMALSGAKDDIAAPNAPAVPAVQEQQQPAAQPGAGMGSFRNWLNSWLPGAARADQPQQEQAAQPESTGDVAGDAGGENRWANFCGIDAQVSASIYVVAPDVQHAIRAVPLMVQAYEQDAAGLHLEPRSLASITDLQREHLVPYQEDEDYDPDFDRPRD